MMSRATSAHARLKSNYRKHLEIAVALGVAVHLLAFALVPPRTPAPPTALEPLLDPTEILEPPPEYRILTAPAPVTRPEFDVIAQQAAEVPPVWAEPFLVDTESPPFPEPPQRPAAGHRGRADFVAVLTEPELVHQPAPDFDETARELGMTGTVLIEVLVGKDGRVIHARVLRSDAPERLQQSALRSARGCLFRPGRQGSRPVEVMVILPYRFTLETR